MTAHAADRQLVECQDHAFQILTIGLGTDLTTDSFKGVQLGAVLAIPAANKTLDFAESAHRLATFPDRFEISRRQGSQNGLCVIEFLFHPEAGLLIVCDLRFRW